MRLLGLTMVAVGGFVCSSAVSGMDTGTRIIVFVCLCLVCVGGILVERVRCGEER